jgi:hypothetical protein
MKYWLYIPFLFLMAVTYTRVSENYSDTRNVDNVSRLPASFEVETFSECLDLPEKFNPHFLSQRCL